MLFFFFNDTATTEIYTLSLHDALPISACSPWPASPATRQGSTSAPWTAVCGAPGTPGSRGSRSEEHTSELQSQSNLVCRLLLEKKKKKRNTNVKGSWSQYSTNCRAQTH